MTPTTRRASEFNTVHFPTWCPGCGDFGIWGALKQALINLDFQPHEFVIVYGIGCSGNMANFVNAYGFHGLHGRTMPVAAGIKMANHKLPVIVIGGDGDGYGEGLGHFLHAMRANHDITYIVHNNQIYGLTTGQTSPTSVQGFETKSTPTGVLEQPINPLGLAITAGASFVARGFAGHIDHLTALIEQAVRHRGFSLVDILQPCITFNHLNTHDYFRKRVKKLEEDKVYDRTNPQAAWEKSHIWNGEIPIGVFYEKTQPTYEDGLAALKAGPLVSQPIGDINLQPLLDEYR